MLLLNKVFKVRDKANPDAEMSFLDHLEDLRGMFTKIVLTLIIATIGCFMFKGKLIDILRLPLDRVWIEQQNRSLPEEITFEDWEEAKKNSKVILSLTEDQRTVFFEHLKTDKARFHTESALLLRSVLRLPEDSRKDYIAAIPDISDEMKAQLSALEEANPQARASSEGDLRMMGAFKPTEAFMLSMKLSFFAAIVVTFPLLLFFILQFILPGLHQKERRALWPALIIGFGLFLTGVGFAYFFVLPRVLEFFYTYSQDLGIDNDWRIGYYISFATQFVLIFGLAFELPVVVMTLVKIGILQYDQMKGSRAYAMLAIVIIAAVITPTPDVLTLMLLAVPMYLLYEVCIWLSYFVDKKQKAQEAEEERAYLDRIMEDHDYDNDHAEDDDDDYVEDWSQEPESDEECDDGKPI